MLAMLTMAGKIKLTELTFAVLADATVASAWSRKLADKAGSFSKAGAIKLATGGAIVMPLDGMKSHVIWADGAGLVLVDFYPGDDYKARDEKKLAKTIPKVPVFRPARRAGKLTVTSGLLAVLDPAKRPPTPKQASDAVKKAKAAAIPGCTFVPLPPGDYEASFEVLGKGSATYEDGLGEYATRLTLTPA